MSVTTNILQRTFHIRRHEASGTCFTLDVDGRQYLATARHVVAGIQGDGVIEIAHGNGKWLPLGVKLVGHGDGDADVSVLAPRVLFGAPHPLSITTAHLMLAEDLYFLGFPFGMSFDVGELNAGFPMPLVKKGYRIGASLRRRHHLARRSQQPGILRWPGRPPRHVDGADGGRPGLRLPVRQEQRA